MRRSTLITLIVLFVVIAITAIIQLTRDGSATPFEGPRSPGQLPSPSATASP